MATTSTKAMYAAIRNRLLTFAPMGGGATLDTRLRALRTTPVTYAAVGKARLYAQDPPENAVHPFGVIRLLPRTADGAHHEQREFFDCELQFVDRPFDYYWELQDLADLADQAMLRWADASGGFIGCKGRIRQTVPRAPIGSPADRETVQELIRYSLIAWPSYITQYNAA